VICVGDEIGSDSGGLVHFFLQEEVASQVRTCEGVASGIVMFNNGFKVMYANYKTI
jgi:hypothetical protein